MHAATVQALLQTVPEHRDFSHATTVSRKSPNKTWRLEKPRTLSRDDPGYLCPVCRHIDFRSLVLETSIEDVGQEIPLSEWSEVLEKQQCAFCRLLKTTIEGVYGINGLPVGNDSQPVKISMVAAFKQDEDFLRSLLGPRRLRLWIIPDPVYGRKTPALDIEYVGEKTEYKQHDVAAQGIPTSHAEAFEAMVWPGACRRGLENCRPRGSDFTPAILPTNFRLIDVKKLCVVPANNSFEYVTLSYVRGRSMNYRLLSKNVEALSKEGSLSEKRDQLPQTVRDAIYFTKKIYERFLWVDQLCIVQDDEEDQLEHISCMGDIYSASALTIASIFGDNINSGMPGVRSRSRSTASTAIETVQDIRLAVRPQSFKVAVEDSVWNTRAWTYAEKLLSKRVLYVTKQQLFFKCEHHAQIRSEATAWGNGNSRLFCKDSLLARYSLRNVGVHSIPENRSINTVTFARTVEQYTSRKFSNTLDISRAFNGIAVKLGHLFRGPLFYGLPQTELDYALCWFPAGRLTRRTDFETGRPLFPSWSWMGWTGPVHYAKQERFPRIQWVSDQDHKFEPSELRRPRMKSRNSEKQWLETWKCHKTHLGIQYFSERSKPDVWFRHPTAPESERIAGPSLYRDTDYLRFWASTISVYLSGKWTPPKGTKDTQSQFPLSDNDGYYAGSYTVPTSLIKEIDPEKFIYDLIAISRTSLDVSKTALAANEMDQYPVSERTTYPECIADDGDITLEKQNYPDEPSIEDDRLGLCIDRKRFDIYKPYCVYACLLVEWRHGIAYRIGTGTYHVDAWAQEPPVKKLITLG